MPPLDMSEQNNKVQSQTSHDGSSVHAKIDKMIFQTEGHKSARIEELMDTLECPVCLDTADTAPVYQCPEGHLICKVRS